jgi:tetraacyldisaccharide 4'-kinase
VHALAGIADPRRFFEALGAHGIEVDGRAFPDHHRYRAADLEFARDTDADLLCTEKDAVKLEPLLAGTPLAARLWRVPLRAELPAELLAELQRRLRTCRPQT